MTCFAFNHLKDWILIFLKGDEVHLDSVGKYMHLFSAKWPKQSKTKPAESDDPKYETNHWPWWSLTNYNEHSKFVEKNHNEEKGDQHPLKYHTLL